MSMYVCPDCKGPLEGLSCSVCGVAFPASEGFPNFLRGDERFGQAAEISAQYDIIYSEHDAVWGDQGRTPEFISYFSQLAGTLSTGRVLEVGCGEGFLLQALNATDKNAVDLSVTALKKSRGRAAGSYALALAERLPFPADSFDLVISVGVMEHFLDDDAATAEIRRVLRPGGHYLTLIHVHLGRVQRLRQKLREFVFPRPRPAALVRWATRKMLRPIHQPILSDYTVASARACLERNGLAVRRTISLASDPAAPLIGPHVVIYVAERKP
jgi:SAM-dependent methyltransferase